jgi:hypothetical protein
VDVEIIYRSKCPVDKVCGIVVGGAARCGFGGEQMSACGPSHPRPKAILITCGQRCHWTYSFSRIAWTS